MPDPPAAGGVDATDPPAAGGVDANPFVANAAVPGDAFQWHVDADPSDFVDSDWTDQYGRYFNRVGHGMGYGPVLQSGRGRGMGYGPVLQSGRPRDGLWAGTSIG